MTDWMSLSQGHYAGRGHRIFQCDSMEPALLELSCIEMAHAVEERSSCA